GRDVASVQGLNQVYHDLGALEPNEVFVHDQWWRLLSYGFVHNGFLHLLFNMIGLLVLGPVVERMWGTWRYLVLYLTALVCGGCAALLALQPVVGASGAISGVLIAVIAWVVLNRESLPGPLINRILGAMFGNLAMLVFLSFMPGVSWQCHLGGAVGGLLV